MSGKNMVEKKSQKQGFGIASLEMAALWLVLETKWKMKQQHKAVEEPPAKRQRLNLDNCS